MRTSAGSIPSEDSTRGSGVHPGADHHRVQRHDVARGEPGAGAAGRRPPRARRPRRTPRGYRARTAARARRRPARCVRCESRVTSADHCRNSSAWCTASGLVASTPMTWSRTSHPWQYGQCSTSRPHRCARPGTSGSSSTSPVVTSRRRACDRPAVRERHREARTAVRAPPPAPRPPRPRRPRRRTRPPRRGRSRAAPAGWSPRGRGSCARGRPGRCAAIRRPPRGPTGATGPAPAPRSARPRRHPRSPRRTSSPSSISSARRAGRTTALTPSLRPSGARSNFPCQASKPRPPAPPPAPPHIPRNPRLIRPE